MDPFASRFSAKSDGMTVAYVPRPLLAEHFRQGWRFIAGLDYRREDWAVLLWLPETPAPASDNLIAGWCRRFNRNPRAARSNKSAANKGRYWTRAPDPVQQPLFGDGRAA
jgi:hypothetical protein